MSRSIGIYCPHCGARMITAKREKWSPLVSTLIATCRNPECLTSVGVSIEIGRQIHPSLSPAPEIAKQLEHRSTRHEGEPHVPTPPADH